MLFSCRAVEADDLPHICQFPQHADELFYIYPKATYNRLRGIQPDIIAPQRQALNMPLVVRHSENDTSLVQLPGYLSKKVRKLRE